MSIQIFNPETKEILTAEILERSDDSQYVVLSIPTEGEIFKVGAILDISVHTQPDWQSRILSEGELLESDRLMDVTVY